MADKPKRTPKEREQQLMAKIEQAKKQLEQIKTKRKLEIGALAYKYGLETLEDSILDKAFSKLAKEFADEHA